MLLGSRDYRGGVSFCGSADVDAELLAMVAKCNGFENSSEQACPRTSCRRRFLLRCLTSPFVPSRPLSCAASTHLGSSTACRLYLKATLSSSRASTRSCRKATRLSTRTATAALLSCSTTASLSPWASPSRAPPMASLHPAPHIWAIRYSGTEFNFHSGGRPIQP